MKAGRSAKVLGKKTFLAVEKASIVPVTWDHTDLSVDRLHSAIAQAPTASHTLLPHTPPTHSLPHPPTFSALSPISSIP